MRDIVSRGTRPTFIQYMKQNPYYFRGLFPHSTIEEAAEEMFGFGPAKSEVQVREEKRNVVRFRPKAGNISARGRVQPKRKPRLVTQRGPDHKKRKRRWWKKPADLSEQVRQLESGLTLMGAGELR